MLKRLVASCCGLLLLAGCNAATDSSGTKPTLQPLEPTAFATVPPVTAPPPTEPGATTTLPPDAPITYTIVSGDYLYGIAKNHGVSAQDIVTINGWESVNHSLTPGEQILIPSTAQSSDTAVVADSTAAPTATSPATATLPPEISTSSTAPPSADPPPGSQSYTVKDGDTVYGIAKKFGISPQALVDANGWGNVNHNLYPGDEIVVPPAS